MVEKSFSKGSQFLFVQLILFGLLTACGEADEKQEQLTSFTEVTSSTVNEDVEADITLIKENIEDEEAELLNEFADSSLVTAATKGSSFIGKVVGFSVYGDKSKIWQSIAKDGLIDLNKVGQRLNIRANVSGRPASVRLQLYGATPLSVTDSNEPFTLSGAPMRLTQGQYFLVATPFSKIKGSGTSGARLTLKFLVVNNKVDQACGSMVGPACEVFKAVNAHRKASGLAALSPNSKCIALAESHSKDMAMSKFFSHTSPTQGSLVNRAKSFGLSLYTGENTAAGQDTAIEAVDAWMRSPGHKANILNTRFRSAGIGFYYHSASPYKEYWTQCFNGDIGD